MLYLKPLSAVRALLTGALLLGLMAWAAPAEAQKARVLHSTRSTESPWVEYIKKIITDTGLYPDGVDDADVGYTDPQLMDLINYKLIVVIGSDFGLNSGAGIGNPLGDYMTMVPGGSVLVFAPYLWQTGIASAPPIAGRFAQNYSLISPVGTTSNTATKLGITTAGDPLVMGLMSFACGTSCQRLTGLMPKPGATVSAQWDDGNILAIRGRNRVDLNMMPADSSVISGSYDAAAAKLITNSIVYLSSPLSSTPGQVAFSATPLGSNSTPIRVTLKNGSRNPLSVTGIDLDGADKAQFSWKSLQSPTFASPLVLAAGASFTVDVTYRPQKQGTHNAALTVNTVGFGRSEVPLSGSSKGNLFVSGSPIDFGGIPTGTTKGPVMVTLTNAGAADITLKKPVIGDATRYVLTPFVNFDTVKLAPGATYRFTVEFKPVTDGEFLTNVTVESDDPSSPLLIPVRGLAGPPKLAVAYTALLMPDVPNGQKGLPLDVLLTNTGNSLLTVSDITSSNMDYQVTMPAKPLKIEARESAVFQITFSPQGAGLRTGRITIKSDEPPAMGMPSSDKYIDLAGTATVPKFRVSGTSVDFGKVDIGKDPGAKTVTLYNDGDGVLRVTGLDILAGPNSDSFKVTSAGTVPFNIPPFGSTTVQVLLQPKSAGMLAATLRVVTDLMAMGTAQIDLKAEVNGAVAQVSPATIDFGSQKVKSTGKKTFSVKNVGNKDLTIRGVKLTPGPMSMGMFTVQSVVNAVVAAGASKDVEVSFTPSAAAAYSATIAVDTDDPAQNGGTQFTVGVTGNGVIGNVSINPLILDFTPAIYVGQTSGMQAITVRNAGDVTIDNLNVRVSGPDAGEFMRVGTSKSKLTAGESTDIAFVYAPKVAKAQETATVVIEADGVAAMMMVQLKGSSLSPLLRVQPDTLRLDNTEIDTKSMPKFVTIVNDGPQKLEIEVGTPTSEDFEVDTTGLEPNLGPGESTRFAVIFAPKSTGSKSETIDVKLKGSAITAGTVSIEGEATKKVEPMKPSGCAVSGGATAAPVGMLLVCALVLIRRRRRG